jgi:hypothetical protein
MLEARTIRIVADADGNTRFVDAGETLTPIDFAPPAPMVGASQSRPARTTRFIGAAAGWDSPPHPAPAVQWVITLRGTVEVRTTDGVTRTFGPGTAVHLEDTVGPGHATRILPGDDWVAFVVAD